jgi:hypothetical protein
MFLVYEVQVALPQRCEFDPQTFDEARQEHRWIHSPALTSVVDKRRKGTINRVFWVTQHVTRGSVD